jgi:hypothetical protein
MQGDKPVGDFNPRQICYDSNQTGHFFDPTPGLGESHASEDIDPKWVESRNQAYGSLSTM